MTETPRNPVLVFQKLVGLHHLPVIYVDARLQRTFAMRLAARRPAATAWSGLNVSTSSVYSPQGRCFAVPAAKSVNDVHDILSNALNWALEQKLVSPLGLDGEILF